MNEDISSCVYEEINICLFGFLANMPYPINRKRVSNPPSQAAESVLKCGYGSADSGQDRLGITTKP